MTGWSKFAHTSGSIKLETFHECLKLEAVTPSVPVSGPGPGSLGRVLVSSELSQTRLGPARARVKTSQSCQFFWWVSSVRRGSAISLGNICSIKFSNLDKSTHTGTHSQSNQRRVTREPWGAECITLIIRLFFPVCRSCLWESGANAVFECNFRPLLSDCV